VNVDLLYLIKFYHKISTFKGRMYQRGSNLIQDHRVLYQANY